MTDELWANPLPQKFIEASAEEDNSAFHGVCPIMNTLPEVLEDLMARQFPEDIWLVDGLMPGSGITVLSATPGSFKTWLLLDLARCVASGTKLFGEFATTQTGVLMIDEENGERLLQQRLNKLGVDQELPIYFLSDVGFKLSEDTATEVVDYCNLYDIGLVTFDSLVRVHDANENDSKEMAEVFRIIRQITKAGISVVMTHHNRKPSGNSGSLSHEMRGSSDILAALDCHLALSRAEQRRLILTQTKVRLAEELPPIELEIVTDEDRLELAYMGSMKPSDSRRQVAETSLASALESHSEGLNQRQLLDMLERAGAGVNARTLRSILEKLLGDGQITQERGMRNSIIYKLADQQDETSDAKTDSLEV